MSYQAEQTGFKANRGVTTPVLTGSEVRSVTLYEAGDTDPIEIVTSGIQVKATAAYPAINNTIYTSQSFFGTISSAYDSAAYTFVGVNSNLSINNCSIYLGYVAPAVNVETGESVTCSQFTRFAEFAYGGGVLRSSTNLSVSWSNTRVNFYTSGTVKAYIDNASTYAYKLAGTAWTVFSDERLKQNFRPITDALGKINALNPTHFEYKNTAENEYPSGTRTGFIAQEVEQVFPGHVCEADPMLDADKSILGEGVKAKALDADFIPYLVKAIQELSAKVTSLEAQLAALTPAP